MRQSPKPVALAACLSLLGVQLTGLHLHANIEGFDPVVHGTHVHGIAHEHVHGHEADAAHVGEAVGHDATRDRHDHEGDRDVTAVELGAGAAKLSVFLVGDALELVASTPRASAVRGADASTRPPTREPRWRPPLRGPPQHSV